MNSPKNKDNKLLAKLAEADQRDRKGYVGNEQIVSKNDAERKEKVEKILEKRLLKTSQDFFNAALIFQHGGSLRYYKKAQKLAKKSMDMGNSNAKWLYAAATDRTLMDQGKKQKYGTQYHTVVETSQGVSKRFIEIWPYDRRISDKTRKKYNIPPLKKLKEEEESLTKKFYKRD